MNKFLIIAATTIPLAFVSPALASGEDAYCGQTSGQWMSKDAVKSKVAALGYEVRRIKRDDGCYEVYAIDKNGGLFEIYINPVTGAIVKTERKS